MELCKCTFKSQCWRRGEGDGMRWTLNKFTSIVGGMDTHLSFKLIKESSKMENCFSTLQVTESYRRLLISHVGQHYAQSMRMTSLARCVCVVCFPMLLPFLFWACTSWAHTHKQLTFYLDVTIYNSLNCSRAAPSVLSRAIQGKWRKIISILFISTGGEPGNKAVC